MYLGGEFGGNSNTLDAYQASTLYAVDRMCTFNKELKDFYNNGGIIVLDRYVDSNMLHQACKISDLTERHKFLNWLDDLEFVKMKLPRPNKTIFLDVAVEVSLRLARARETLKNQGTKDIHEADDQHMYQAYAAGKYVCNKYNWSAINCIDNGNMRTIDDIAEEIYNVVIEDIKNYEVHNGN
jgi:dTMP kinase